MIRHVLKDGTIKESIKGYKITREQFPQIYRIREKRHEQKRANKNV